MEIIGLVVRGDSGATYTVRVNNAGLATCSCPAFRFGGRERAACKHITFALETLQGARA